MATRDREGQSLAKRGEKGGVNAKGETGKIGILNSESAAIRFGERADCERVGVDEGLVNLHFAHLLCRLGLETVAHTPA